MPASRTRGRQMTGRTNASPPPLASINEAGGAGTEEQKSRFARKFVPPASSTTAAAATGRARPRGGSVTGSHRDSGGRVRPLSVSSLAAERVQARAAAGLADRASLRGVFKQYVDDDGFMRSPGGTGGPNAPSSPTRRRRDGGGDVGRSSPDAVGFEEFKRRCDDLELPLDPADLRRAFASLDRSGSGLVNFHEFIRGVVDHTAAEHVVRRGNLRQQRDRERRARVAGIARALHAARAIGGGPETNFDTPDRTGKPRPASAAVVPVQRSAYLQMIDAHRRKDAQTKQITEKEVKEVVVKLADKARSKFKGMSDMFNKFDQNKDGALSFDDFHSALKHYAFDRFVDPKAAYAAFASLDANDDDHVSYREFMQVFNTHLPVSQSKLATSVAPDTGGKGKGKKSAVKISDTERSMVEAARLQRVKDKLHGRISDMASADALNNKRESQTLIEAFRKFDKDTDGTIDYEELLSVNDRLNLGLKANEVAMVFRDMDKDGSGAIDVREFLTSMRSRDFADNYDPLQVARQRLIGSLKDKAAADNTQRALQLGAPRASRWATDTSDVVAHEPVDDSSHPLSPGYSKRMFETWRTGQLTEQYGRPGTSTASAAVGSGDRNARPASRLNFRAYLQQQKTAPVHDPTAQVVDLPLAGLAKRDNKQARARAARAAKLEKRLGEARRNAAERDFNANIKSMNRMNGYATQRLRYEQFIGSVDAHAGAFKGRRPLDKCLP